MRINSIKRDTLVSFERLSQADCTTLSDVVRLILKEYPESYRLRLDFGPSEKVTKPFLKITDIAGYTHYMIDGIFYRRITATEIGIQHFGRAVSAGDNCLTYFLHKKTDEEVLELLQAVNVANNAENAFFELTKNWRGQGDFI